VVDLHQSIREVVPRIVEPRVTPEQQPPGCVEGTQRATSSGTKARPPGRMTARLHARKCARIAGVADAETTRTRGSFAGAVTSMTFGCRQRPVAVHTRTVAASTPRPARRSCRDVRRLPTLRRDPQPPPPRNTQSSSPARPPLLAHVEQVGSVGQAQVDYARADVAHHARLHQAVRQPIRVRPASKVSFVTCIAAIAVSVRPPASAPRKRTDFSTITRSAP